MVCGRGEVCRRGRGVWVGRGGCGWWEHVCASLVYRCSHMCIVCVFCVLCVYYVCCVFCVCVCVCFVYVCVCVCTCVCVCVFTCVVYVCVLCGVNVCGERGGGVWKE